MFRGLLQSALTRATDPTAGWLLSSLLFGPIHASNAIMMSPEERLFYLALGLPYITTVGLWLGHTYRATDYHLAAPVALHFWYDFLLVGTAFVLDPDDNPLSARIAFRF